MLTWYIPMHTWLFGYLAPVYLAPSIYTSIYPGVYPSTVYVVYTLYTFYPVLTVSIFFSPGLSVLTKEPVPYQRSLFDSPNAT